MPVVRRPNRPERRCILHSPSHPRYWRTRSASSSSRRQTLRRPGNMAGNEAFFDGFLDDYFAESEDHLTAAAEALLKLDAALGHPALERAIVDDLFRYFHTLKAISAMVELRPAEQLAHHLEHYLRAIREGDVALSAEGTNVLIEGTRRLELIINAHRKHVDQPSIADLVTRIETVAQPAGSASVQPSHAPATADNARRWVCTFSPTKDLLAAGMGVDAIRKRLGEIGTIVDAAPKVQADGTISFQFTVRAAGDIDVSDALRGIPMSVEPAAVADRPIEGDAETAAIESAAVPATAAPSHMVRV